MYEVALAFAVVSFLLVCGYYWRSPAFSMFHPLTFYLAFHGLLFVVRPVIAWERGYTDIYRLYEFTPSLEVKTTAVYAATIGMLSFAFFCLRVGGKPMRFVVDEAIVEERRRLSQVFVWVLAICGPAAAYSLMKGYGPDAMQGMVRDAATGFAINTQGVGYVTDLQLMAVSLCSLVVWLSRFRLWSFVPIVAFITLRAGTGGRGPFVAAIISAGLFYLYEKRIRYPGLKVVLFALALFSVFVSVGQDRGASIRQAMGMEEKATFERDRGQDRFLESMDFGNLEFLEYIIDVVPEKSGTYDYFLDNFQLFTEPVPRIFWPGKPVGEPFRRIWLFEYGNPIGMTRSLPGEGWYAMGWLGVIIVCGIWGHVLGWIYSRFVSGSQTTFKTACYLVFLPTLVVSLRDGGIVTIARQTGVYLAPVFVWYWVAKYAGVPTAAQIRAVMARTRTRLRPGGPEPEPAPRTPVVPAYLPAAVRRRRALLLRERAAPSPTAE